MIWAVGATHRHCALYHRSHRNGESMMLTDFEAAVFVMLMAIIVATAPRVSEAFMLLTFFSAS